MNVIKGRVKNKMLRDQRGRAMHVKGGFTEEVTVELMHVCLSRMLKFSQAKEGRDAFPKIFTGQKSPDLYYFFFKRC